MSTTLSSQPGNFPDTEPNEQEDHDPVLHLPDLNGVDLVMSLSPKGSTGTVSSNSNLTSLHHLHNLQSSVLHNHSTPFSVTDILSPIEEYRKLELNTNPPSPYR